MKRMIVILGLSIATILAAFPAEAEQHFLIYYGSDNDPALAGYDTIVFDADHHPPLAPLTKVGKTVLGYISLGEVEKNRAYYAAIRKMGLLGNKNDNWPDSRFIDVRDRRAKDMVIQTLIPGILSQGFSGLFLDTLDDPPDLERRDPKRFKGMTAASIDLVKRIRQANPDIPIMMNRGYDILPEVKSDITMELAESLTSDYDFDTHHYRMVPAEDTLQTRAILRATKIANPILELYSLDYWWPSDHGKIADIYRQEAAAGFIPYVATIDLTHIIPSP